MAVCTRGLSVRVHSNPSKMCANRIPHMYLITDLTLIDFALSSIHAHRVIASTGSAQSFLDLQKALRELNPHK
jgi:hypothetical protein